MSAKFRPRYLAVDLLVVLLLTSAWSLAETGKRGSLESVERGARLYQDYCITCHGQNGIGEPPIPWGIRRPDYITAMPLDESSHAWHHGDENLVQTILMGTPRSRIRMPVWDGVLSNPQASDLVAYIKSLWSDRILSCQGPRHMSCM